jgi:predicted AAA+ superfamily ATPase
MHTGTGRITSLVMRPMSLFESKESTGEVSLVSLFNAVKDVEGVSNVDLEQLTEIIVRGGWPRTIADGQIKGSTTARSYLEAVIESDISRVDGVQRNPHSARALLRSISRSVSQQTAGTTIQADMQADGFELAPNTMKSYLNALRRIYVIDDLKAWAPKLRSKTALRTSPTWHLSDPSLAAAALGADGQYLLSDLETLGFLFESMAIRDLRVYLSALGGEVYHYRDSSGLEADAILQLRDGRWAAVEVKLGGKSIDNAAANLTKLEQKLISKTTKQLVFKLVLTGGKYAYRRKDGVFVVPLACLKP